MRLVPLRTPPVADMLKFTPPPIVEGLTGINCEHPAEHARQLPHRFIALLPSRTGRRLPYLCNVKQCGLCGWSFFQTIMREEARP